MQREPVESNRAEEAEKGVACQSVGRYRMHERQITNVASRRPLHIWRSAETESFLQAPLATPHWMTGTRSAETRSALFGRFSQWRHLPYAQVARTVVVEID